LGLRERRRHVQGGDHRRGLRDPRQVRLRGPGGRQARVLVPVRYTVRQGQAAAERAAATAVGRRFVGGAGGAGQRHVRLH